MLSISIVGTGRMGGALAVALSGCGFRVENLIHRNAGVPLTVVNAIDHRPEVIEFDQVEQIASQIIFITVRDREIKATAESLSNVIRGTPFVFHTSGSLSSAELTVLAEKGCRVGSLHPLVSISDPVSGAGRFDGAYFCVEGDTAAVEIAGKIVQALGGSLVTIPTDKKALYHAAAVTASGHLVALIDVAIELLSKCGLGKHEAQEVLMPLISSTVENLLTLSPADALTGPFARADAGTVDHHLESFSSGISREIQAIYLALGERSLALATEAGADPKAIESLRDRISIAKRNSR